MFWQSMKRQPLKLAWQETLPADTVALDMFTPPRQPTRLAILTENSLQIRVWKSGQFALEQSDKQMMMTELYCVLPFPTRTPLIFANGTAWEWSPRALKRRIPSRDFPVGRVELDREQHCLVQFDIEKMYAYPEDSEGDAYEAIYRENNLLEPPLKQGIFLVPKKADQWRAYVKGGYKQIALTRFAKSPAIYAIIQNRLAQVELRPQRGVVELWKETLPAREAISLRIGDPKNEGSDALLVFTQQSGQRKLLAYRP